MKDMKSVPKELSFFMLFMSLLSFGSDLFRQN